MRRHLWKPTQLTLCMTLMTFQVQSKEGFYTHNKAPKFGLTLMQMSVDTT